jgi:rSAM/selenodomain-associated transferase 2
MKLSIVVPSLNEEAYIFNTLAAIASMVVPNSLTLELLLVDGGSTDRTLSEVERFFETNNALPVRMFRSVQGRAAQQNCGAEFATGDVLWFLHADTLPSPNALIELQKTLQNPAAQFGYFYMKFDSDNLLAKFYSDFTKLNSILTHYGDCGIFMRRDFFFELGKFPEQDLMEDVELLFRARAVAEPALIVDAFVTTSARRFKRNGFLRQQVLNAYLVGRYIFGASPSELKKRYEKG